MSKIVLDEKEVNELFDTFDFNKSKYLQELQKITGVINKLDDIQKTQKEITDKLESYTSILSRFEYKNEKEMSENYFVYLSFLSKKVNELSKNSYLNKLEKIIDKTDYIINLSIVKVIIIVAVITTALNFLIIK